MSLKLVPLFLLLVFAVALGIGQATRNADALVSGALVPSATEMVSGAPPITILVPLDGGNEDITVTILGLDTDDNLAGLLLLQGCVPGCPLDAGESTDSDATPIEVDETDGLTQLVLRLP